MQVAAFQLLLAAILAGGSAASAALGQELLNRKVSLKAEKWEVRKVLRSIEQQASIRFAYRPKSVPVEQKISITATDMPLSEVLEMVTKPLKLRFEVIGEQIVLSPEQNTPAGNTGLLSPHATAPNLERTVTGRVSDDKGQGLPGVSVVLKGTQNGTITDGDGKFSLTFSQDEGVMIFSFVGYLSQEIPLTQQSTIDVTLVPDTKTLEELVVVGYGVQKKTDLTGSVVSVGEKDFTQGVNNSALQLVNGKASGVQISQSSSAPGGGISIRIRGAGSINSSNEALIVVDGLPGASATSISPDDIESIQILKDASAAAIYGSRAANGVVLITTKKGKKGATRINYNAYVGIQSVAKKMDMLNARQYMQVLNDLSADQGGQPKFTEEQMRTVGTGTDWQDQIFRKAIAHNHQLSFSGGSDKSAFYLGVNYLSQEGVVKRSGLKKYNVRLNYELNPSDKFKVNLNLNTNRSITNSILTTNSGNENAGPINTALQFDPTIPAGLNATGKYPFNPLISLENPLALINGVDQGNVSNRTFGTLSSEYTILKGWTATLRLGGDIENQRSDSYVGTTTQRGLAAGGLGNVISLENNHWISEFFTSYNRAFNKHNLSVLGGATLEKYETRSVGASSMGFLSDVTQTNLLESGDGDRGDNVKSDRFTNKLNSYLGRVNYTFDEKYLLTASMRADGTSRFSDKNKFAFFPSFALGWRLSEEPFLKQTNFFNDLKLRLSYGKSGNQAIGNFETLQTLIAGSKAILGGGLIQGVEPARIPNTNLKWETTEELDLGIDFSVFQGRLSGSLEYFIKNTSDQLFNKPLPTTSGFESIRVNFGTVRNRGIDLMLESRNFVDNFKWNTTFTLSALQNKVTELPDFIPQVITGNVGFTSNYAIVRTGDAMRSFYGYQIERLFQTTDDIASSAQPGAKPGYPKIVDQNKDGKIDPNDRVILGSPFPKFIFGLNNSFAYKGFNLNVLVTAVQGIKTLDGNIIESLYPVNFERNRLAAHYLDRWTPSNPNAKYPSGVNPSAYGGALAVNSMTVTDASFARLKTVTLSYDIPFTGSKTIKSASVYLAADNLLTITKFQGYDPDANASGTSNSLTSSTATAGVSGTSIERASYNSYPLNRTFRVGLNIGF